MSLNYLVFVANESLSLTGKGDEDSFAINIAIPYAGLGVSTAW